MTNQRGQEAEPHEAPHTLCLQGCLGPEWPCLAAPGGQHVSADGSPGRQAGIYCLGWEERLTRGPPSRPLQPDAFSFSCPEFRRAEHLCGGHPGGHPGRGGWLVDSATERAAWLCPWLLPGEALRRGSSPRLDLSCPRGQQCPHPCPGLAGASRQSLPSGKVPAAPEQSFPQGIKERSFSSLHPCPSAQFGGGKGGEQSRRAELPTCSVVTEASARVCPWSAGDGEVP